MSESKKDDFKTFYALSLAWQLGFLIAVSIGGFLMLGFWLDKKFNSSPLLLIIGLILGIIITVYEVYHSLNPLLKNSKKSNNN